MKKLSNTARVTLTAGSLVLLISLGLRHSFGLYLQPVSEAHDWGRGVFSFAIAIQNLVWGFVQPVVGVLADKLGAKKIIFSGAVFYVMGLLGMSWAPNQAMFMLFAGGFVGLGLAGTTMPVVFAAISRALPAEKRSLAFGVAMSVGSLGQFAMMPAVLELIGGIGWVRTLVLSSAVAALILPLSLILRSVKATGTE